MNNEINKGIQNSQGTGNMQGNENFQNMQQTQSIQGRNETLDFDTVSVEEYVSQGSPKQVVAVHMEGSEISLYKLDDGTTISKRRAVQLCEEGVLQGYVVGESKYGEEYLRGIPDGKDSNNLQELPKF
jgi:hypothetical protein